MSEATITKPLVRVGVAVLVIDEKNKRVLMGKRRGHAHGSGCYQLPGGHLEFGESWEECGKREVLEETGIELKNISFAFVSNDIFKEENKHYVTIFMESTDWIGEPQVLEPEKCESWGWYEWGNLPEPLFLPMSNLVKSNFDPFLHKSRNQ